MLVNVTVMVVVTMVIMTMMVVMAHAQRPLKMRTRYIVTNGATKSIESKRSRIPP